MKPAAALAALALAGCGDATRTSPGSPAPSAIPPSAAATVTTTPSPNVTGTPAPKPTPSPSPGRRTRHPGPIAAALIAYFKAVNTHDVATLCDGFTAPTPVVCGGPGRHLPEHARLDRPAFVRATVTGQPRIRRDGARAEATVDVVVDAGRQHAGAPETLVLLRRAGAWSVSRPSPVFFRSIGRAAD